MLKGFLPDKEEWTAGWKKWLVAAVILFLATKGEDVYNQFNTGVQLQEEIVFNNKVDSISTVSLMRMIKSPEVMAGIMNSPFMIDYKRTERDNLIKQSLHKDSAKVKMSASLSLKTGLTKAAVIDSIAVIINLMKKGRPINNDKCISNSKKYNGRSHRNMNPT